MEGFNKEKLKKVQNASVRESGRRGTNHSASIEPPQLSESTLDMRTVAHKGGW